MPALISTVIAAFSMMLAMFNQPAPLDVLIAETWPEHRIEEVKRVAWCESNYKPGEIGDGGRAYGLMQIRIDYWPDLHAQYDLLDPRENLIAARIAFLRWRDAFGGSGWGAWSCQP